MWLETMELQRIEELTHVPSRAARQQLYEQAKRAETARAAGDKTSLLLSKMANQPFAVGAMLIGINNDGAIDPNATVLARISRQGGKVGDKSVLTVMNDRDMPLMGTSFGANGVLTDCQQTYGTNRLNLFYQDEEQTLRLLLDYLQMRDKNSGAMLAMFVGKLQQHKTGPPAYAINLSQAAVLTPERQVVYDSLLELFGTLQHVMSGSETSLASVGLGMRSFCQTWMRDGVRCQPKFGTAQLFEIMLARFDPHLCSQFVGNAEFSVMSPHFQTRIYINDAAAASKALQLGGYPAEEAERLLGVYASEMVALHERMLGAGYAKAFVDLDLLQACMRKDAGRPADELLTDATSPSTRPIEVSPRLLPVKQWTVPPGKPRPRLHSPSPPSSPSTPSSPSSLFVSDRVLNARSMSGPPPQSVEEAPPLQKTPSSSSSLYVSDRILRPNLFVSDASVQRSNDGDRQLPKKVSRLPAPAPPPAPAPAPVPTPAPDLRGIPIAASTGRPDRRYAADSRHASSGPSKPEPAPAPMPKPLPALALASVPALIATDSDTFERVPSSKVDSRPAAEDAATPTQEAPLGVGATTAASDAGATPRDTVKWLKQLQQGIGSAVKPQKIAAWFKQLQQGTTSAMKPLLDACASGRKESMRT